MADTRITEEKVGPAARAEIHDARFALGVLESAALVSADEVSAISSRIDELERERVRDAKWRAMHESVQAVVKRLARLSEEYDRQVRTYTELRGNAPTLALQALDRATKTLEEMTDTARVLRQHPKEEENAAVQALWKRLLKAFPEPKRRPDDGALEEAPA
jgi:hypothetical protein